MASINPSKNQSDTGSDREAMRARMKRLPQMSQLLDSEEVSMLLEGYPRPLLMRALRDCVDELRRKLLSSTVDVPADRPAAVASILGALPLRISSLQKGKLQPVINATGVVLNTNLGRAPLPPRALERLVAVARGYTNLEIQLRDRQRGGRMAGIASLCHLLTDAPATHVVNNNAAAVLLALAAMARGKEVVISRGELVEIGGSFRIPEVMEEAGVTLREVGTTNRTHLRDYEAAIGPDTGLLLKVHQSNYSIQGFTKEVSLEELVELGKKHNLPVMYDLGSGSLLRLEEAGMPLSPSPFGTPSEPTIQEILRSGVDVVTCSGDKLLGGPQAGILLGAKDWIAAAARHPLARALRVDKLTLAALEATLQVYAEEGVAAVAHIPAWAQLTRTVETLREYGETLLELIDTSTCSPMQFQLETATAPVGGGALPTAQLPTLRLAITHPHVSVEQLDRALRHRDWPIVGLLDRGRLLLDLRTLHTDEFPEVATAVRSLAALEHTRKGG